MKEERNPKSEIRNPKTNFRISSTCALVLLAGALTIAMNHGDAIGADDDSIWKPFLAGEDFDKLVQSEVKAILDELAKSKVDDKKIRGSAIIIALAAQNNKGSGDPMQMA